MEVTNLMKTASKVTESRIIEGSTSHVELYIAACNITTCPVASCKGIPQTKNCNRASRTRP